MKSAFMVAVSGAVWLMLIGLGTSMMMRYELTPGPSRAGVPDWPAASRIARSTTADTLVVFIHPRCPCSRATIDELSEVMARSPSKPRAYALVLQPAGCATQWAKSPFVASMERIPGVTVLFDRAGVEARRFHAATSGYALLYDRGGRLLFSGGLTSARGETGENAGADSVLSLLSNRSPARRRTAVFGCSLFGSEPGDRKETDPCPG